MAKRIVSFAVILLAYAIIGSAALIGTSNFGLGFGGDDNGIRYAYALDRAGDIYYISDVDGEKTMVSVDSSGKKLFEKSLEPGDFGENFYVDQIYVEHDRNIFLTVYEFDKSTRFIVRVSVHAFREDGSYFGEVFADNISVYPNARSRIVSSMSEDDANIYFAVRTGGKAALFSAPKNNAEPAAKIAEFNVGEEIYGMIAVSSEKIAVGGPDGITVYDSDGEYTLGGFDGAVFDRFWNGISCFYALDSASGNIYSVSGDRSVTNVVGGRINAEEELVSADLNDVAVGITGNFLGTVRGKPERLYYGSFSVMSRIIADTADRSAAINRVLAVAAVCAGVLLLAVLTWDFFCSILKMRLSILLRQSLLIALLMFVALYSLLYLIIIPNIEDMVQEHYTHKAELIANSFEHSINGAVLASETEPYEAYEQYLTRYGVSCALPRKNDFSGDDEKPMITLVGENEGRLGIIASSGLYPNGYPADLLMYDDRLTTIVGGMPGREYSGMTRVPEGERLCLIRCTELSGTDGSVYMIVEIGVGELSTAVADMRDLMNRFLTLGGVLIVVLFMVIENITAGAVRRLKRAVDRIAGGEYGAPVNIRTGDEVEDLSVSVKSLAEHIVEKTASLEKLNHSYYRFVPQSFLANLGETQIERVEKSLYARKRMAVLFLRFRFSQPLSGMDARDIFDSINSVYEQIMPILGRFGGTGYNFLFNGLSAIFPDSTKNALRAAIKIRETIHAFNEIQRAQNRRTAQVHVVIGEGEVLLGFIGDAKRMEPTVVSTAINESEDIEKILSDSGLYIVCTERAFRSLPSGKYRSRCIGDFVTSEGTVKLFDMFDGDPYTLIKLKEQFITRFELGVRLFRKGDYVNARNMFMEIVKYAPDDGVSRNYLYLSEHNISAARKQLTYTVYSEAAGSLPLPDVSEPRSPKKRREPK